MKRSVGVSGGILLHVARCRVIHYNRGARRVPKKTRCSRSTVSLDMPLTDRTKVVAPDVGLYRSAAPCRGTRKGRKSRKVFAGPFLIVITIGCAGATGIAPRPPAVAVPTSRGQISAAYIEATRQSLTQGEAGLPSFLRAIGADESAHASDPEAL